MRNTYEWCAKGVVPQKHILQNESVESIQCLFPILEEKKVIVIDDMEQIGKQYPAAYAFFKSLDISSFAAGPIKRDGEIIGFSTWNSGRYSPMDLSAWMSRIRV